MKISRRLWLRLSLAALYALPSTLPASAQESPVRPAVILISIDGLKPEYVLDADAHGLKIPTLRRFLREGAYSTGVHGVVPTVTYPSHTTLITGVTPAKHGIYANTTFDPLRKNFGGWYWYAEDIKVPTLWDAAADAGLSTANVHWPVSVAAHITWNLPQYWRAGTPDDRKLLRILATPGLLDVLEKDLGPYADGIDETITGDENRAKFAARLLELKHPAFATIYLTALDHEQHASGPFSPQSNATLERIDAAVSAILTSIQRTYGDRAVVCIVSDHGFVSADKALNLAVAFRNAGLIEFGPPAASASASSGEQIKSWKATIWGAGGSAAIVLHDKNDAATKSKVAALLAKLAADPANGVDRIVPESEFHARGGFPGAAFLVTLRPGFVTGDAVSGNVVTPSTSSHGMHGYWPDLPEMNASFFILGPGIPAAHSLGLMDMRAIAPTLAQSLGWRGTMLVSAVACWCFVLVLQPLHGRLDTEASSSHRIHM
ncbi:MAG: alkaline phosphatase family protein, partial [Candidatus Acidiferrales bacterium]